MVDTAAVPTPGLQPAPANTPAPAPAAAEPDMFAEYGAPGSPAPAGQPPATPAATPVAGMAPGQPTGNSGAPGGSVVTGAPGDVMNSLGDVNAASPLDTAEAIGLGAAKGAFATKDFFVTGGGILGQVPDEKDRSSVRQWVDRRSAEDASKWGAGYSLTEGAAQAAVGLLGVGKIALGGKLVGETLGAVTSFGPHAQNFANLVQAVPGLANPVAQYLSSSEGDSDTIGYAKNALTSLGISATVGGLILASAKLLRAMRGGADAQGLAAAHTELQSAVEGHQEWQQSESSSSSSPSPSSSAPSEPSATGLTPGETTSEPISPPSSEPSGNASGTATPSFHLGEGEFDDFLTNAQADQDALLKFGSWDNAIANGHTFGSEHVPWHLLGGTNSGQAETALDAFMARSVAAMQDRIDVAKGGAVETDAMNAAAVEKRVTLWGQDPASLFGQLQAAGEQAQQLRAQMETGFTLATKIMQDSWTLAARIKLGDFEEFGGSQDAALAALQQHWGIGMQIYSAANSMLSNAGRTVRGAMGQFRIDPAVLRNMASLSPEDLVSALNATGGDPRALVKLATPTVWERIGEGLQLYLVNNLISSPLTHTIIIGSNLWQTAARPAMRMAGAAMTGTYATVGREAAGQYGYMATSLPEALRAAKMAFGAGDSIISPHDLGSGLFKEGAGGSAAPASGLGQAVAQAEFGPWNNMSDILSNLMLAAAKTGTFPTRFVGFQDELVKQVVYRGIVQSRAATQGAALGLTGDALDAFVKDKLYSSFDSYMRATDMGALQEAKVATYQNDLLPGTQGAKMQQYLQGNPAARAVVPFLRTPVNLFRQGVQLTPGLNMAQTEFRNAIMGKGGDFARAQAYGQMAMGTLLMGTAAMLAYNGNITGDGPSDTKLKGIAIANGWRPNSLVWSNPDGSKTYVPFNRYDPIMMPMAMAANIVSVLTRNEEADQRKAEGMVTALGVGFLHSITDKLYLQNFQSMLEAVMDPDKSLGRVAGKMAGNYLPFSSLLHFANENPLAPIDPYMREADGFVSAALNRVPGYSTDFAPRRDYGGDPITVHKGLWLDTPGARVDAEVRRLALEQGGDIGAPSAQGKGKADLRAITLAGNHDPEAAGRTAYDRFQELAGHPAMIPGASPNTPSLKQTLAKLIDSPAYQNSPDGGADAKGTKASLVTTVMHKYRDAARTFVSADKNVMQAEYAEQQRVAAARGGTTPNSPTPTNTLDSVIQRLGASFGMGGLKAPAPAVPTTGVPQQ